jgi:hypothetical protein
LLRSFAVAISPPLFQFTPYGLARSLDIRHQVTLAINSILTAIAMLSVVAATVVLKNDFGRAVKAIPAVDDTLLAENGTAFTQLYLVIVFGGLSLLQCLTLIAEVSRNTGGMCLRTRQLTLALAYSRRTCAFHGGTSDVRSIEPH